MIRDILSTFEVGTSDKSMIYQYHQSEPMTPDSCYMFVLVCVILAWFGIEWNGERESNNLCAADTSPLGWCMRTLWSMEYDGRGVPNLYPKSNRCWSNAENSKMDRKAEGNDERVQVHRTGSKKKYPYPPLHPFVSSETSTEDESSSIYPP